MCFKKIMIWFLLFNYHKMWLDFWGVEDMQTNVNLISLISMLIDKHKDLYYTYS